MLAIRQLSRFRAASIHLGISAVIAAAAIALMLALWYPPPLFGAMGGMTLIALVVGVDVALGPLLTLIVFDPHKKDLPFDLAIIAALQLSALAYGVHAMHAGRPVFIAFVEDHFAVVPAAAIETEALARARPEFRSFSLSGPTLVAVEMPADARARTDIFFASLVGLGAQHLPQYYVPYTEQGTRVAAIASPLAQLALEEAGDSAELDAAIARTNKPRDDIAFVPIATEYASLTALVEAKTGALLGITPIKPIRSQSRATPATKMSY